MKKRVWDKAKNKWVTSNIVFDCFGNMYWDFAGHLDMINDKNGYVVEDFTGFQDKRGVDIYEGDCITFYEHTSDSWKTLVVKRFESGAFKMDCDLKGESFKTPVRAIYDKGIVIGNVNENKESIEEILVGKTNQP